MPLCHHACVLLQKFFLTGEGNHLKVSSAGVGQSWDAIPPGGEDAVLRWFEAFADALQQQRFSISNIVRSFPDIKGINMFPVKEPWQVTGS